MLEAVKRFGRDLRRRWPLTLLGIAAVTWGVIQVVPVGKKGTSLELMALGADGTFAPEISIPDYWADTVDHAGSSLRVPLILGVRNNGTESAPPTKLELSLPSRYRLTRADGRALPGEYLTGTPMVRYWLDVPPTRGASGTVAGYLPVLDTVWLEPIIPSFYCITLADSVPDFVPSPPAPVEAISHVRIFYSFTGDGLEGRQTGLLAVELDPELLEREIPEPPPVYPTEYTQPGMAAPYLSSLEYVGSRRALCGDPEDPIEILSILWETPEGGRLFVLDYGGAPRKYLYDLNRDSIIELEIWDASGAGSFDARRRAHLPIPEFLIPARAAPGPDPVYLAELEPEELLALDRYGRAVMEPYTFRSRPPDEEPNLNRYRPGMIGSEQDDRPDRVVPRTLISPAPPSGRPEPRSPVLGRPGTKPTQAPRSDRTRPPEDRPRDPVVADPPAAEEAPKPEDRPTPAERPEPREPKVLGKPLDERPRRPPPDTSSGHLN